MGSQESSDNKKIFHVDIDAFFAAIEIRDDPSLVGKPVIIGADPKKGLGRGVVTTCSYEARKFGLHSAMPISKAYKLCPHGVYLHGRYEKYHEASGQVMNLLKGFDVDFQQTSIDEAYLDFTDKCSTYIDAFKIAKLIQIKILDEVGITCSIGVSHTKTISKIASDFNKPNGITIIERDKVQQFLGPMEITKIPGIGKKSKYTFYNKGIFTIKDLYSAGLSKLVQNFGDHGVWIWNFVMGLDSRPVKQHYNRKSIGKERTFMEDEADSHKIIEKLSELNSRIHDILVEQKFRYSTITMKIRLRGFITYTRSKTMTTALCDKDRAYKVLLEMYESFYTEKSKVRLIGVRFSNLEQDKTHIQTQITDYI